MVRNIKIDESVSISIDRLEQYTAMMGRYGAVAAALTACNLGISLTVLALVFLRESILIKAFLALFPVAVTAAVFCVLMAVLFERYRKRGETLFEEISDELQWQEKREQQEREAFRRLPMPPPKQRPDLNIRVVLRNFAKASDLPLVPGKFGPTVYVSVNLLSVVLAALQFRILLFR